MKIQFPLWLVTEPRAASTLADVRTKIRKIGDLEAIAVGRHIHGRGGLEEDAAALYTDETEATADAQARLDARDAADNAGWIPLRLLRPGATFETQDGGRFLKTADSKGALCVCYDLEHGQRSAGNVGASLVREIKV